MKVTFKTKDGNSFVIDTEKFCVESMSVKDISFKRENDDLVCKGATYRVVLVSEEINLDEYLNNKEEQ